MSLSENSFANPSQLDSALAAAVAARLESAIAQSGEAWLVVSGGRTPLGLFAELANTELSWNKVKVTLADERWVDNQHRDSNEKLVRENLLVGAAAQAEFVSLKTADQPTDEALSDLDDTFMRAPRFAALILGMGDDGHTASLFPGARALPAGLDMNSGRSVLAVEPLAAPHLRISLTLPRLLDSDEIFIHIVGENKQRVLQQAQADGPAEELPIRAILRQQATPVSLYWSAS